MEKFWKLDEPSNINFISVSPSDKAVVNLWENTVIMKEGKYVLPIPFKGDPPRLPDNFLLAKHHLDLLGKRLQRDRLLHQEYTQAIHNSISKRYASEVLPDHQAQEDMVWYFLIMLSYINITQRKYVWSLTVWHT